MNGTHIHTRLSSRAAKCLEPCSNMYKQCSGVCMKKRQHAGAHRCSHCGYTWSNLMVYAEWKGSAQ